MELRGKGVSKGLAIGRIRCVKAELEVERRAAADAEAEVARFEKARARAAFELGELAVSTEKKLGEANSLLFKIHQMMLEDLDYCEAVVARIRENGDCAEYAVSETAKQFSADFAALEDEYLSARAADVLDVSRRVIEILQGKARRAKSDGPAVLAATDFAPSETAQLEPGEALALLTAGGSANSHTAIFARTMGIPAVIGLGDALCEDWDGRECIVDGEVGTVLLDPTPQQLLKAHARLAQQQLLGQALAAYRGRETRTRAGQKVLLCVNVGCEKDTDAALANDAEGIGLFRSEFLYLGRSDYPDEETQFAVYRAVAEKMGKRPVVIRTLDIGADKKVDYFKLPDEENPAMGLRALRICLTRPEIFRVQLRAIYRASPYGNLHIMLPMVASLWEIEQAQQIAAEVRAGLSADGLPFQEIPIGIMIETPAAAVISDLLAQKADFFSIGTNDLTQYTLAVDRQNDSLSRFCDTHHEAVLRLIELTVKNAHAAGIWVGICGELGADEALTERFVKMGIDELSVTPPALLSLRKRICEL